jgi:hypothetical protein
MSDKDLIRRGDVINVIHGMHVGGKDAIEHALPNTYAEDLREIIYEVDDIPAVPQETNRDRAKGEWIYKERHEHYPSGKPYTARYCGVCGRRDHNEDSDYCGYCGADMREAKDDER